MMLCDSLGQEHLPTFLRLVGNKWLAEPKLDGVRIRIHSTDKVKLVNRTGKDVTRIYPELSSFTGHNALFDGELVVFDSEGVSRFNDGISYRRACQSPEAIAEAMSRYPVTYVIFDILELDGENLRNKPLNERREILINLNVQHARVKIVEQSTDVGSLWEQMKREGKEGIIIKKKDSLYREGYRSTNWRKVKILNEATLTFTKYDRHSQGVVLENDEGIRVNVNGFQAQEVEKKLHSFNRVSVTIRHLGAITKTGKYRQPTFLRVENE